MIGSICIILGFSLDICVDWGYSGLKHNKCNDMGVVTIIRLRYFRMKMGWTQKDLAEKVGLSETTIWNFENGRREPRLQDLKKFAEVFNCTIDELVNPTLPPKTGGDQQ